MRVAIIDADLIGRTKHRFPNLACMKLSAYYKSIGADVELKLDYDNLHRYDLVSISKVFIDTELPYEWSDKSRKNERQVSEFYKNHPILRMPNVVYGGTGFYYDKAPPLPDDVEHMMPDYHLYDMWVQQQIDLGVNMNDLKYYRDWSIGFMTRGCIRQCANCVNKNYKRCELHSPLSEFLDESRPYICLLDDNIFACPNWKSAFDDLINSGKRFQFKQGLDERLLTEERCDYLFRKANWVGDKIFAFDNIEDQHIIVEKLDMIRRYTTEQVKFYVFCAFNHDNPGYYDNDFYKKDIADLFERIHILMTYGCLPYIMRYKDYKISPYRGIYTTISRWCNQPSFFKKKSLREFAEANQARTKIKCADVRNLEQIEKDFPDIAEKYFDMKFEELNRFGSDNSA